MERAMLMKLGMWVEIDEWCTTVNVFPIVMVEVKVTGTEIRQIWSHARSIGSDKVNGGFHIMSSWEPLQGVMEPAFLISFQGLGHGRPNLGHLAKSS